MTALRVVYLFAMAFLLLAFVGAGIVAFYEPPEGEDEYESYARYDDGSGGFQDYARNVSIILTLTGATMMTGGLWLTRRFNAARPGLLLGGLATFMVGAGFWAAGSDHWVGFVIAGVTLAALAVSGWWRLRETALAQQGST